MPGVFRFSFGPWNISQGADPFGPDVRAPLSFDEILPLYRELGFEGVQFHDDDAVPGLDGLSGSEAAGRARELRKKLDDANLSAEFVAPRLWEDPRTVDGGYTSNDAACRRYAIDRSRRAIDIARELGTDLIVLWLAREGTYIREAKDSPLAIERLAEALDAMLKHDESIRLCIEPKPNEPVDLAFIPTAGHAIALGFLTGDPARVGVNIESAHAVLAGLDPSEEMAFTLAHGKLWSVHLNDQNGLKFDQDKSFGSVDLRRAFNQVRVLDRQGYGRKGEWVGLDVKAMRTQKEGEATRHLSNSRHFFLRLLEISRGLDEAEIERLRAARDYESLERLVIEGLVGLS